MLAAWMRTTALGTYCLEAKTIASLSRCSCVALNHGLLLLSSSPVEEGSSFMSRTF
jgi:hypothetical protein